MARCAQLCLLIVALMVVGRHVVASHGDEPCSMCRGIVENFKKGIENTAKKNFGGGNTAWEAERVAKYEQSETRLVEILESLCDKTAYACHAMLEQHEEHLEKWWFHKQRAHPDLYSWFCVEMAKVCCPAGSFGPDCNQCQGEATRPCAGNGRCDGDGTRRGTGLCVCHPGYVGSLCLECEEEGFYLAQHNDTHALCSACHSACKTCSGPQHTNCGDCRPGYAKQDEEGGCVDVDECASEPTPCHGSQFCSNTEGSYVCKVCDPACEGCKAAGPDSCHKCLRGYTERDGVCVDVNECEEGLATQCVRENEVCVNTEGGYRCECGPGFHDRAGACKLVKPPGEQGLFDEISEDELVVLRQMAVGVVLCALATLAAKGDMVYTSLFIGAAAATAGYWLSERGDRLLDDMLTVKQ
uniref:Cysteine-rich with EGF-like domain protein 2-B isoform X1 n=1 Tax=Petromyzon marinus TaxID=7757 RepID=A0AAJ7U2J9_PETMA|nr:cysteine-rich with EGF-like domain protein 2-B isoform X1 [Petromyzon marinus]